MMKRKITKSLFLYTKALRGIKSLKNRHHPIHDLIYLLSRYIIDKLAFRKPHYRHEKKTN